MFFIDDDQTQLTKGQKYRGSDSDDKSVAVFFEQAVPYFSSLAFRKLGVIHHHIVCKYFFQAAGNLCGQRNFRQQKQHLLSTSQAVLDQMEINLCLTT